MVPETWPDCKFFNARCSRWYRDFPNHTDGTGKWLGNKDDKDKKKKYKWDDKIWLYSTEFQDIRNQLFDLSYELSKLRKKQSKIKTKHRNLKLRFAKYGLNYKSRNQDLSDKYQQRVVRQFSRNVDEVLQFFDGQIAGDLLVTRDYIRYKYKQNRTEFSEIEMLWTKGFQDKTNKMIKEYRQDPEVILRRCVESIMAYSTVRGNIAARQSVCMYIASTLCTFGTFSTLSTWCLI